MPLPPGTFSSPPETWPPEADVKDAKREDRVVPIGPSCCSCVVGMVLSCGPPAGFAGLPATAEVEKELASGDGDVGWYGLPNKDSSFCR